MVDLNKARQARAAKREADETAPTVTIEDKTFELPIELPYDAVEFITRMAQFSDDEGKTSPVEVNEVTRGFIAAVLGPRFGEFMELRPSTQDIEALMQGVLEEYGMTAGESSASESS